MRRFLILFLGALLLIAAAYHFEWPWYGWLPGLLLAHLAVGKSWGASAGDRGYGSGGD